MSSQSQEMLDACTSGDVVALQRQFEANNIPASNPVYGISASSLPPVNSMLVASITNGRVDAISLILRTYPGRKVQYTSETIEALLCHPNLEILQILYDYDPSIVSFEWDSHTATFVTKACEQPPTKITPLLLWLIEHDADLEAGYFLQTLCNAISGGQTLGVIKAMVDKGARVSPLAMRQAVVCERVDIINFLVDRGMKVDTGNAAYIRSDAKETGNKDVIETVEKWTSHKSCVVS